jgi:hypothetical protein
MSRLRFPALLVALWMLAPPAGADRVRFPAALPFGDSYQEEIQFPQDFSFPFGGVNYKSCWIGSDGTISFHQPLLVTPNPGGTVSAFLGNRPMLAPLWADLDPSSGGTVTAGRVSPTEFAFRWDAVPAGPFTPGGVSTFRCVLRNDGSFRFEYGSVNPGAAPSEALVGFTTGVANTVGQGTAVDFTTLACPGAWGNGEPAVYQVFNPATAASVLSNRTLCFNPTHQSGRLSFTDDDTVHVALAGWSFPFHGNHYTSLWVGSNGYFTLGGGSTGYGPSATGFVNGVGRIAALYTDLNPVTAGQVVFTQSPGQLTVSWNGVPYYGQTGTSNTFSISLTGDGAIVLTYAGISNRTAAVLVGQTGGYPATSGSEGSTPLTPGAVHGSGPGAVFHLMTTASPFPYANNYVAFDNVHVANAYGLPLDDDGCAEVPFPGGFTFPFGTGRYGSAFFHTDGWLTFGGADVVGQPSRVRHLSQFPRICGTWTDLTSMPAGAVEGALSVVPGAGTLTFQWNVSGAQFSIRLNADGSFALAWAGMSVFGPSLAGYSTGGGTATGSEGAVSLASRTSWGTGTETAIFEEFPSGFPLTQRTLAFAPVGPTLYQRPVTSPGTIPLAIGAGAADAGLLYVLGASLGSQPGITIQGCGTIPLNLDPILMLTMSGLVVQSFMGTLDGIGELSGWPSAAVSPMAMLVPANLSGRGLVLYVAFLTVGPPGTPCRLRTISPAVPFRI